MFNPSHPFGTVHGSGNAIYYQDGKHYDADHQEVDIDTGQLVVVAAEPTEAPEAPATPAFCIGTEAPKAPGFLDSPAESAPTATEEVDLGSLPYQTIKKMVISAGGVYVDKAQGVAYLRGM